MNYWLMKSEEHEYSIDQLKEDGHTHWDGVRNYQARNFMRDDMKIGDRVLYYHSNSKPTGVVGLATVCREGYPDFTAWDPKDKHFDPKTQKDAPTWIMVDIAFDQKFDACVELAALKANAKLEEMKVVQRGQRLSVQPVEKKHFNEVCRMAGAKP